MTELAGNGRAVHLSPRTLEIFSRRPVDMPDGYYQMWDGLIEGMQRESLGVPNQTLTHMMIERVATLYTRVRILEDGGAADSEAAVKLWLSLAESMGKLLERHQAKPEQRFMSGVKAAITAAMRKVNPATPVREFIPVLVEELRQYDI